jgi:hypothetical protein
MIVRRYDAFICDTMDHVQIVEDELDFKVKIENILRDSGFSDERAAKMDVDDLLK